VPHSTLLPNTDAVALTPPPEPGGAGVPTCRVPAAPMPARIAVPELVPLALSPLGFSPPAVTPAPVSDLALSTSWGSDGEPLAPGSRRPPRVGDTLLGFRLAAELGRGAFARVYLAEQAALANRPVALKVTLRPTREAERLARLQHTNVVPVYSVHADGPVQLICMPFLGRVTIADLIRAYRSDPSRLAGRKSTSARAARSTAVNSSRSHSKVGDSKGGRAPRTPTWTWSSEGPPPIVGDPREVLEALAQLAAGLAHAHERGILHLDLKPANVLLADTGEPMLLDFNLSFDAADPDRQHVGGTVPYMAIEQLLDMRHRGKGQLDARTDLYALGAMAFEMLTGAVPFPVPPGGARDFDAMIAARRAGPPPVRERNPAVTPAVEAIVRKLLAPEPADRYQSADQLREDIERHLGDRPLKYAREASARERFGKWRRRNPRLALRLVAAGLLLAAAGMGAYAYDRAGAKSLADEEVARGAAVRRAEESRAALDAIRLDLALPNDPKAQARGARRAAELLASYGLPADADWQNRPDVRRLSESQRAELAADVGELMALLAPVKWREGEGRPEPERRALAARAWALNAAARACFADGAAPPLLDRQAAALAPAAGEAFTAAPPREPAEARALFLDACDALARGRYAGAIPLFVRVTAVRPNHAAAHFCLAYCRQQMGQYDRALERYDAARVLLPSDPRPAYQRGLIYAVKHDPAAADEEFTKALALDPDFADAYRHRALARYRFAATEAERPKGAKAAAAKLAESEADLNAALGRGAPALFVHFARAQVRDRRGDRAGADADRKAATAAPLRTEEDFVASGWARLDHDPTAAAADFRKALELNPRSLPARQNLAHVLAEKLKEPRKALAELDKLVGLYPEHAPAVAGRALVLARLGEFAAARQEIERARLLSDDAEILYQAASVYSLASKDAPEDLPKAVALLRDSLKKGHANLRGLEKDPDFDPLRANGEFQEIRRAADALYR
jgi:serine/threonine protein kinase/Tfp pilus assembly protein PilF